MQVGLANLATNLLTKFILGNQKLLACGRSTVDQWCDNFVYICLRVCKFRIRKFSLYTVCYMHADDRSTTELLRILL